MRHPRWRRPEDGPEQARLEAEREPRDEPEDKVQSTPTLTVGEIGGTSSSKAGCHGEVRLQKRS